MRTLVIAAFAITASLNGRVNAQSGHVHPAPKPPTDSSKLTGMADHAMSGPMNANMMKHMELTPLRTPSREDSARATRVAAELKRAIAKYQDTAVAVADGYEMFLPNLKHQRVYHFTNNERAVLAAFHFDATKPTSLLHKRGSDGKLQLTGAMYTMPKNVRLDRLDDRIPLSIARWHKHVNWCVPKKGDAARWLEKKNGSPIFGPEGSIATKAECDAAKGEFHPSVFGWMLHANVYEGGDLATIFGDEHHDDGGHAGHTAPIKKSR
jgi:hypothetical protein